MRVHPWNVKAVSRAVISTDSDEENLLWELFLKQCCHSASAYNVIDTIVVLAVEEDPDLGGASLELLLFLLLRSKSSRSS